MRVSVLEAIKISWKIVFFARSRNEKSCDDDGCVCEPFLQDATNQEKELRVGSKLPLFVEKYVYVMKQLSADRFLMP